MTQMNISRREFLKLSAIGFGGLAFANGKVQYLKLPEFPQSERLGRVCYGMVELKARPDENAQTVGRLFEDAVVPWFREIVGKKQYYINKRWVETPEGYIYAPYLQPVLKKPNATVDSI